MYGDDGKGYLSAHVNLSTGRTEGEPDRVWMGAIDTSQELSNTHLTWPGEYLREGDVVRVQLLPGGEGDLPTRRL